MSMVSDQAYAALFSRLTGSVTGVAKFYPDMVPYADVPADLQPAMVFYATDMVPNYRGRNPTIWTLDGNILFYVKSYPNSTSGSRADLNGFVDQVVAALERRSGELITPTNNTTLGGTCIEARINGIVKVFPRFEGTQSMVEIPFQIAVADT